MKRAASTTNILAHRIVEALCALSVSVRRRAFRDIFELTPPIVFDRFMVRFGALHAKNVQWHRLDNVVVRTLRGRRRRLAKVVTGNNALLRKLGRPGRHNSALAQKRRE